jgi:hypothetical protein
LKAGFAADIKMINWRTLEYRTEESFRKVDEFYKSHVILIPFLFLRLVCGMARMNEDCEGFYEKFSEEMRLLLPWNPGQSTVQGDKLHNKTLYGHPAVSQTMYHDNFALLFSTTTHGESTKLIFLPQLHNFPSHMKMYKRRKGNFSWIIERHYNCSYLFHIAILFCKGFPSFPVIFFACFCTYAGRMWIVIYYRLNTISGCSLMLFCPLCVWFAISSSPYSTRFCYPPIQMRKNLRIIW